MRVLIVDDNEDDAYFVKRVLNGAFPKDSLDVKWVQNPSEINIQQEINDNDVCLIDQNMDSISGLDIIRASTEHGSLTPTILLTGDDDRSIDEQASQCGASDYLAKNAISPALLNRSIRYSIAQRIHAKKLSEIAFVDGLTGLANRPKFDQALSLAIDTTERANSYLALFVIDLDDFKIINDTYGHPAGDAVLKEVANRISATVRKTDIVARLGGDEFAVVLNGYNQEEDIRLLTEKMLSVFEKPVQFGTQTFHFRCSMGIALLKPDDTNRAPSDLVKAADGALYKAKNSGKNSFAFYDNHIGRSQQALATIENELASATAHDELELYFQPKINASTMAISGAEALLRWNRPSGEKIGPADFIPIAERSLSILSIGKWVIEEACRVQKSLIDSGLSPVPLSVNVSPIQIQGESFVDHIVQTITDYDIDPSLIEFEITETVLMQQYKHIVDRIMAVANFGCSWAIDDFGIGYSSLSLLNSLPISKIKLDKSFVDNMEASSSSRKICNIVSLLAHELDLTLVAEGVERKTQLDLLMLLSKDELQGFYFSKGVPLSEYKTMLEDKRVWT